MLNISCQDLYIEQKVLGSGTFGRVILGQSASNCKEKVAIKVLPKEKTSYETYCKEAEAGKILKHQGIPKLLAP